MTSEARILKQWRCAVNEHKPWRPRIRQEPLLNPFEPPRVSYRDAVAERPEVTQASGAELNARGEEFLRMSRKAAAVFPVVQ